MTLNLEQLAFEHGNNSQLKSKRDVTDCYDFEPIVSPQQVSGEELLVIALMAQWYFHLIQASNVVSAFVHMLPSVNLFYNTTP
jgi:hypothetical protein